jgi:hypothetical protein
MIDAQSLPWRAQRWGGGEVASADGIRFVIPRTIYAEEDLKFLGKERDATFYCLTSDQC